MRSFKGRQGVVGNSFGSSITSVLVAAGMVGIIAVGVLKLAEVNLKSSHTASVNYELGSFKDEIRQFLSVSGNCTKSFQKSGSQFNEFKQNTNILFNTMKKDDGTANGVVKYDSSTPYRDNTLKIKKITLGPYTKNSATDQFNGATKLFIEYEKQGLVFGSKVKRDEIELHTALKGGGGSDKEQLVSCSAKLEQASGGGDCSTKSCVRAEIANAMGGNCFEIDNASSCSGDYQQAGTRSYTRCIYVLRDGYSSWLGGSGGGAMHPPGPGISHLVIEGVGSCPAALGTINAWESGSSAPFYRHSFDSAHMALTQSASTVKICCRKFPP